MPLLATPRAFRRIWVLLVAAVLCLPLAAMPFGHTADTAVAERRDSAPPPRWPTSRAALSAFPAAVKAWLGDRFGLRRQLVAGHALLRYALRDTNAMTFVAPDGSLFFRGDSMLQQSAGMVLRTDWVAHTAQVFAAMQTALDAQGGRLLFASPPNAATTDSRRLPKWARGNGRATELDALLAALRAHGVPTLDLRPVVAAAAPPGEAFLFYDTHWRPRAELAAYNAMAVAAGLADWQLAPADELGLPEPRPGGDLVRMLGVPDMLLRDVAEPLKPLPFAHYTPLGSESFPTYVQESGHPGPTLAIIGDSFTVAMPALAMPHAGRVLWMHMRACTFDFAVLAQYHPEQVWVMPTERYAPCWPGNWPASLPHP